MSSAIERASEHSNRKLSELRSALSGLVPEKQIVVTCGSYARREASDSSDLDFFAIGSDAVEAGPAPDWYDAVKSKVATIVLAAPAANGAFAEIESASGMLKNVGGDADTNLKITRRMLLLLEGEWLHNKPLFEELRRKILERYIGEGMTDHQLALFLLNDIIRFYRTMAVDYEFKTTESEKPRGIRNIKLIFSRKLLYASGLFSVAETADRARDRKIERLEELFALPVLSRMERICGAERLAGVKSSYEYFMSHMERPEVREQLRVPQPEHRRDDKLFRDLKNEGHHFTRELLKLFELTFDSTHPIRRAVVF